MAILNLKFGTQPEQVFNPKDILPKMRATLASCIKNGG
jgi:hypothetical protein